MTHIGVGEACCGFQWGAPSANVATLCHPLGSCVAPDVEHVIVCTSHWLYPICHEPIGGCVECTWWSYFIFQLHIIHEPNWPEQLQMAWLRQWDIVARIPSPFERGYGQLNCGEPGYNYFVHKGGSHPMCVDSLNCTCAECVQSLCWWPLSGHLFGGWKVVD